MEKQAFLTEMGIEVWKSRRKPAISANSNEWDILKNKAYACTGCNLHSTRTQVVFGAGNINAELMVIGEAPGFDEDQKGEFFVGQAGQLLTAMFQSVGLERQDVYIANILKCHPPENRDPLPEEVKQCSSFLEKQIALVKPKLLIALGPIAAHCLLGTKTSLTELRSKTHSFANTPLIVTYHPVYLLRNPIDKGKAFSDLQKITGILSSHFILQTPFQ